MLRNNRGYTLVEVMVTLTLLTIFIACVVAIVSPVLRIYNRTVSVAEDQSIAVNIADYLAGRVRLSTHFEVTDEGRSIVLDGVKYTMQDGYLVTSNGLVFDSAYYGSAKIGLEFEHADNNPFVDIKVHVFREGEEKYSYSLTARPLVFLGKDEEGEEPGNGYDVGDLAFESINNIKVYLSGNWQLAKQDAAANYGTHLHPGMVYKDHTGIGIILWTCWLSDIGGINDITLVDYSEDLKARNDLGCHIIDTSEKILTVEDQGPNEWGHIIWLNPPKLGSLFLYEGKLYVCKSEGGEWAARNPIGSGEWVEVIQP